MSYVKKKKLAFIVAVSSDLSFAAGNIAIALNRYMSIPFDLLVYSYRMGDQDKGILNSIDNCRVVDFQFEKEFIEHMMNHLPDNCRFKDPKKLMRFCHYEAFQLLNRYENVVWLDADISVQADLADILNYKPFGITTDEPFTVGNQFIKPVEGYDMDRMAVCSAVMMLDDSLPYEEIYKWLYENTTKYAEYMKNGDQAIINLMLQIFGLRPLLMPQRVYQCLDFQREAIDARIVHFGTDKKIWNTNMKLNCFPEWYHIHQQWLKLGGADFPREDMCPENIYAYSLRQEHYYNNLEKRLNVEKKIYVEMCLKKIAELEKLTMTQLPKVIIYGTGKVFHYSYVWLKLNYEIVALVDGSPQKQGQAIHGCIVKRPEDIANMQYNKVIVTPNNYQECVEFLANKGVSREDILILKELEGYAEFRTALKN